MILTPTHLHVSTSAKKCALLEPLGADAKSAAGVELVLHPRPKGGDGVAEANELLAVVKDTASTPLLALLTKDTPQGAQGEAWMAALAEAALPTVDAAAAVGSVLASKDATEAAAVAAAGALAAAVLTKVVVPALETVIDEERTVKHSKLAARAERALADPAAAGVPTPSIAPLDAAFPPIIQSGGVYDLKLSAASDERALAPDVVTVTLGARAASYCAIVGRTYLVEPDADQEAAYGAVAAAHAAAVAAVTVGAPLAGVYEAAKNALASSAAPSLAASLGKHVGAGIGLEVRESGLALTPTATGTVPAGAAFHVVVGVTGVPRAAAGEGGGQRPPYALCIADTVVAAASPGIPPTIVTEGAARAWGEVAYELGGSDEEDGDGGGGEVSGDDAEERRQRTLRSEADEGAAAAADRARARAGQDALLQRINQQTLDALTAGGDRGGSGGARRPSDAVAYRSPADVPAPPSARIAVDGRAEAVLVPIYGATLPLHVLTVKNATHAVEGDGAAYVRLALGCGTGYEPASRYPTASLVKELAFRVADGKAAARVVAEIKALRAQVAARDKETAERATLVKQEKLIKAATRPPALPDVWVRPPLGGKGRRVPGQLEAHANGFRYSSPKGETLDVMYRNIKHAFFQPAEGEAITLVSGGVGGEWEGGEEKKTPQTKAHSTHPLLHRSTSTSSTPSWPARRRRTTSSSTRRSWTRCTRWTAGGGLRTTPTKLRRNSASASCAPASTARTSPLSSGCSRMCGRRPRRAGWTWSLRCRSASSGSPVCRTGRPRSCSRRSTAWWSSLRCRSPSSRWRTSLWSTWSASGLGGWMGVGRMDGWKARREGRRRTTPPHPPTPPPTLQPAQLRHDPRQARPHRSRPHRRHPHESAGHDQGVARVD